ncbi:MAG: polyprenyl synthetase family protein, partial [Porticoccaceae bacterium]|nr:polyprenyl synthetase family protein [Porticoccaceae bacterium]
DFLYSRAFQMMVAIGDIEIMTILADTTNIISEGEVQQLINARNDAISEQEYLTVIDKKTARLFEAAARCGAVIAGATPEQVDALGRYGHHLGMAFQLVDDALDYSSDSDSLGKNVGDDLAEGKPTLPLIHILDTGSEEQITLVRRAIREGGRELLDPIMAAITANDSLNYTLSKASIHSNQAIRCLDAIPPSDIRSALEELARFATERSS